MKPIAFAATLLALGFSTHVMAADHLANGATAPGAAQRDFANPVGGNPSATSGPAADPGTVPGLGNPDHGGDTGTPAVDHETREQRVEDRGGRG